MITNVRHQPLQYIHEIAHIKELVKNNLCNINCSTLRDSKQLARERINLYLR